jgi:hypothetical protein
MRRWKEPAWLVQMGCLILIIGWGVWREWNNVIVIALVPVFLFCLLVYYFALSSYLNRLRRTIDHKG